MAPSQLSGDPAKTIAEIAEMRWFSSTGFHLFAAQQPQNCYKTHLCTITPETLLPSTMCLDKEAGLRIRKRSWERLKLPSYSEWTS